MRRAAEDCGKQKKADTCSAFFYVGTPRALRFGQDVRMMNELDQLVAAAQADFAAAATPAQLENAKARYLGKAGRITEHLKALAALSPEDKKAQGAAVNAADGFAVGHAVTLHALGSRSPIASEDFTVTAVTATSITLDAAPSAGMIAAAAAQYGAMITLDSYAAQSTATRASWAFIADDSTGLYSNSDAATRWGA